MECPVGEEVVRLDQARALLLRRQRRRVAQLLLTMMGVSWRAAKMAWGPPPRLRPAAPAAVAVRRALRCEIE